MATLNEIKVAREQVRKELLAANRFLSKKIRRKTTWSNFANITTDELKKNVMKATLKKEFARVQSLGNEST